MGPGARAEEHPKDTWSWELALAALLLVEGIMGYKLEEGRSNFPI